MNNDVHSGKRQFTLNTFGITYNINFHNTVNRYFYYKTNKNTIQKDKSNNRVLKIITVVYVFQVKRNNLFNVV
jgi:hypothetical protein